MSETTKKHVALVKSSLVGANNYMSDAILYANSIGDKALVEKIMKVKVSITETQKHIASRTGQDA